MSMEEEKPSLEDQFQEFSRLQDEKRDGVHITLYCSDYWMRQGKVIDDRTVTMTDTGVLWWKFCKTELNFEEWYEFLSDLCELKSLDQELIEEALANCGLPGTTEVNVPQYRDFFDTYQSKKKLINVNVSFS